MVQPVATGSLLVIENSKHEATGCQVCGPLIRICSGGSQTRCRCADVGTEGLTSATQKDHAQIQSERYRCSRQVMGRLNQFEN